MKNKKIKLASLVGKCNRSEKIFWQRWNLSKRIAEKDERISKHNEGRWKVYMVVVESSMVTPAI